MMNNLGNALDYMKAWTGFETLEETQNWLSTCRPELLTEFVSGAIGWGQRECTRHLIYTGACLDRALEVMDIATTREYHKLVGMMPRKERPEFPVYVDAQGKEHKEF